MSNIFPFSPAPGTPAVTFVVRPTGSLPVSLTPILGREEEIDQLVHLLDRDDPRLVTLLGPGGGKTRLALEIMRRVGDVFAHGARFVFLTPFASHPGASPAATPVS